MKVPPYWTDEFVNWEEKTKEKEQRRNEWICVYAGTVTGRVIGGNLNTIQGIWGSAYMPEVREGDILFIEDTMMTLPIGAESQLNTTYKKVLLLDSLI